jgi:1-deoxy-D-xylulose-5-phosphate synthase
MLKWAVNQSYPIAIRYPRGGDSTEVIVKPLEDFKLGKWELLCDEGNIAIIAQGRMVEHALLARKKLLELGIKVKVINACFIKPIDKLMLDKLVQNNISIVTVEDNIKHGGLGSCVLEYVNTLNKKAKVLMLGFKDEFIPHGKLDILYKLYGLDADGIVNSILKIV